LPVRPLRLRIEGRRARWQPLRLGRRGCRAPARARPPDALAGRAGDLVQRDLSRAERAVAPPAFPILIRVWSRVVSAVIGLSLIPCVGATASREPSWVSSGVSFARDYFRGS